MTLPKRATIYFEPHKALRLNAAHTEKSISDLVNVPVRRSLEEGAEDLQSSKPVRRESGLLFEDVLKDLKRRASHELQIRLSAVKEIEKPTA